MTTRPLRAAAAVGATAAAGLAVVLLGGCAGPAEGVWGTASSTIPLRPTAPAAGHREGPFAPASQDPAPCNTGFIADMVGGFTGQPTAEQALVAWLRSATGDVMDPPAHAPRDGWSATGNGPDRGQSFVAGEWRATALQSTRGEWLITQLDCLTPSDSAPAS